MILHEELADADVYPHVESSDSEDGSNEEEENNNSDSESSESDEEPAEDFSNDKDPEFSVTVDANGVKLWTPKCDDSKIPKVNQHFPTLEDAYLFYREYGRICGFDVRKSTKKSDRRGNLYAKYMICSRGGSPNSNKQLKISADDVVEGPRKKTTSKRCYCKAQIVMKPAGNRGFVMMSFVEEHNHPLAIGAARMFLRCNMNLSNAYQNFIMDCSRANIGAIRAHSLVKEMSGSYEDVGATVDDFKKFSRDVKIRIGKHDTDMLLAKFKLKRETSNNSFYYDYKVDSKGHLTGLFWTDAVGQANYDVFGDIVSFDPTFRTNRYNMVFVPFTGVSNHWKNVNFAAGLLAKENYKNFKWLITTFKRAMGRTPKCVITDQCKAIKKALAKWWTSTTHRLCMWHIMNKLPVKLGPKLSSDKKFVDRLKSVVYADHLTPSEFEEGWNVVIAEYKLENNSWMSDMFSIRDQWIPAYFSDIEMAGLLRTTSRSESSNFFFQHYHESGDTLIEFYSSFESAMDKQRLTNATDDKRSQEIPLTGTVMSIEKDASNLYTLELYYLVREEIRSGCFHTVMDAMTRGTESSHFKCKDELLNDTVFEVSVRHSDHYVNCSCKFFYRKGYLCRHAFAALHHCSVKQIPREFVKPRWTKNAVKHHSFLCSSQVSKETTKQDRTKLKRTRAWFEFHSCLDLAGEDEEKLDHVLSGLSVINSTISHNPGSTTENVSSHPVDKFVGPIPGSGVVVKNPNISRNKGCGSRIKSSVELSAQDRKKRKCSNCLKLVRHNKSTCPEGKRTPDT